MKSTTNLNRLREILSELDSVQMETQSIKKDNIKGVSSILAKIYTAMKQLNDIAKYLDPINQPDYIFDPTDPHTMGKIIADVLEQRNAIQFDELPKFYGSGVYAIYYTGNFSAYQAITRTDCPIYVGKVDPANARATTPKEQGIKLWGRLNEHAKSIKKANNLTLNEFKCRYLVVQSGWQRGSEEHLIHVYKPIWNSEVKVCSGIGKHGDTARAEQSDWDVLHPGRSWAIQQTSRSGQTADKIVNNINSHFLNLYRSDPMYWSRKLNGEWLEKQGIP